jgi:proteic killer suppression protein
MLFEVGDNPMPLKPDGGLDWTKVTTIVVLGVENTHE